MDKVLALWDLHYSEEVGKETIDVCVCLFYEVNDEKIQRKQSKRESEKERKKETRTAVLTMMISPYPASRILIRSLVN